MIRTLIVDDEIYVRKGLVAVMPWDRYGFVVAGEVSSGANALDFLSHNAVDLVITDLTMPSMSGFDLIKELARAHPDIFTVVLTCHQDFGFVQEAMRLGAIDYIVKTQLEKEKLDDVLDRIAGRIRHDQKLRHAAGQLGMNARPQPQAEAKIGQGQKYSDEVKASVSDAVKYMKERILSGFSQEDVAKAVNISKGYFSICFRDIMGMTFSDYVRDLKVHEAEELLLHTNKPVYWIADQLGFQDEKYFSRLFREQTGKTPTEYREAGR